MSANSTGERTFHVRPEAVDLVLSGLVQHVLVSLPANWVQAVGIRPNVSDRFGPKRLWVGRLRHLRLLVRAEALRQATVATHVRLRLSQKVQEAANGSGAQGIGGSTADGMDEKVRRDYPLLLSLSLRFSCSSSAAPTCLLALQPVSSPQSSTSILPLSTSRVAAAARI